MTFEAARGLWEGRREQARVPGGRLIAMTRTANTITLEVEREGDAPIVVNQTWAIGWSSDVGRTTRGSSGLIEVHDVPSGRHTITLRFFPDELPLTVGLTLAGFAMAGVVLVVARRRRVRGG
jgi:uncharacterized membrane protein YfhO